MKVFYIHCVTDIYFDEVPKSLQYVFTNSPQTHNDTLNRTVIIFLISSVSRELLIDEGEIVQWKDVKKYVVNEITDDLPEYAM